MGTAPRRTRRPDRRTGAVLMLVLGLVGMASAGAAPAPAPWRQTRFLLGGLALGAPPTDPAPLLRLAEAGLDFVQDSDRAAQWDSQLRLAATLDSLRTRRAGFRLRVLLNRVGGTADRARFTGNPEPERDWPGIRQALGSALAQRRAAAFGSLVWDEPCDKASLRAAAALVRRLRADPATRSGLPFVNLLPDVGGCLLRYDDGPPDSVWVRYANDYLHAFDGDPYPAPCLSFDRYPFANDARVDSGYFRNLRWARDAALRASRPGAPVPVWVTIQVSPHRPAGGPMMRGPSLAQVRWQAWCAVAYGARSITYWMAGGSPAGTVGEAFGPGLLDHEGRPGPNFSGLCTLGRELHAVGDELFAKRPVATLVASAGEQRVDPEELLARPERAHHEVDDVLPGEGREDCLIGLFKDPAGRADELLVVNRSLSAARTFRLRLGAVADTISRLDTTAHRFRLLARRTNTVTLPALAPGGAVLVRLSSPRASKRVAARHRSARPRPR